MIERLLLLPGMDGTGLLFGPLRQSLPDGIRASAVEYPRESILTYGDLLEHVRGNLPDEPFILVAESFSGPLGVMLATEKSAQMRGLVLCSSFLSDPLPPLLRWLRLCVAPGLFKRPPPRRVVRSLLVGPEAGEELVRCVREAVSSVDPQVLSHRLKEILRVDVTGQLAECSVPLAYLAASHDRLVGDRGAAQVAAVRPDAEITVVPGPHFLLQAATVESARVIAALCERVSAD